MAIFGAQGLVTIIVMTFLQKIAKYYSLGRFALLDLVFYVHPTDEELKKAAGLSAGAQGKDRHKGSARLRNKAQHKDGNEVRGRKNRAEEVKKAAGLSAGAQGKDRHKGSARLRHNTRTAMR